VITASAPGGVKGGLRGGWSGLPRLASTVTPADRPVWSTMHSRRLTSAATHRRWAFVLTLAAAALAGGAHLI
jgi:hypothetical protein